MGNVSSSSSSSSGIGVLGLLGVAFVVLKLTGYIDWSWVWVTAPFWGGFVLILVIFFLAFLTVLFSSNTAKKRK
jgi:phosphoglycerol transferase MdoB-like AlkP superfamily enzyme